uniref:Uncharacterized protein n=1 Tax=Leptospira ellisii TaxID=2023197 RepID=A0A2N0B2Z1_9LEPT|nr:hypothetical protein CH379_21745 [Leptospira ellisii]
MISFNNEAKDGVPLNASYRNDSRLRYELQTNRKYLNDFPKIFGLKKVQNGSNPGWQRRFCQQFWHQWLNSWKKNLRLVKEEAKADLT